MLHSMLRQTLPHGRVCCRPVCCVPVALTMNRTVIPPDALNLFRHAASQFAGSVAPRASRLLTLKDDIAALRKRGVSCRAISELLEQSGIGASASCVMRFCRRVLKERRSRKPSVARRVAADVNHHVARKSAPEAAAKTALFNLPIASNHVAPSVTITTESAPVKSRGSHIAKVELLKPGEQYD
jgi:hypothetical protein